MALTSRILCCALMIPLSTSFVYDVYYTGGSTDMYVSHTGRYEVIFARFAADGTLITTRNITKTHSLMMGYIDVSPDSSKIRFSMQKSFSDDVAVFEVAANATQEGDVKRVLKEEQLLGLCHPEQHCAQASYFSADYAADGSMAFTFRLWDPQGMAIGNQAVGLLLPDGSVRALTFDPTKPFTNNTNSLETCPRFHPDDPTKLFFFREDPHGTPSLHVYDLGTNASWPVVTPHGIYNDVPCCHEFMPDGHLLYIDGQFGKNVSSLVLGTLQNKDTSVQTKPIIQDIITNTSIAADVLNFTNCKPLSSTPGDVACLTKYEEVAVMHGSPLEEKWTTFRLPWTIPSWCKTNSCYKIYRRDSVDVKDVLLV